MYQFASGNCTLGRASSFFTMMPHDCLTLTLWILLDTSVNSLFIMMPHACHLVDTLGYFSKLTIHNDASCLLYYLLRSYNSIVLMADFTHT